MKRAYHGGAFFDAIGADLRNLERASDVISADVLDAWFDPSPRVVGLLREHLTFLLRTSPPNYAEGLVEQISMSRGVPRDAILAGAGSSALLFSCLPRLLPESCSVVLFDPMYGEYAHIAGRLLNGHLIEMLLPGAADFAVDADALLDAVRARRPDAVFIVNPNNPTGQLWPKRDILCFLDRAPLEMLVVVDEAYLDYCGCGESLESEAAQRPNLIVVKSMSKVYALSGARVAYLVTNAERVRELAPWQPPWPVGLLAQAAAIEALRDPDYYEERYDETRKLRHDLAAELSGIADLRCLPSRANFFLIETPRAGLVAASLRKANIFVREFPDGALAGRFLRVAVKDRAANARIAEAVRSAAVSS